MINAVTQTAIKRNQLQEYKVIRAAKLLTFMYTVARSAYVARSQHAQQYANVSLSLLL